MKNDALTPKQERFVAEYLIDLNAKQAAIRAGYKEKAAQEQGSRLLSYAKVRQAVEAGKAKRAKTTDITQQQVIAELGKIGFANMLDYMHVGPDGLPFLDFSKLTRDQAAAIQELIVETRVASDKPGDGTASEVTKVRFKLHDKRAPLVDLGKHLGVFKEGAKDGIHDDDVSRLSDADLIAELKRHVDEMGIDVDLTYRLRGGTKEY